MLLYNDLSNNVSFLFAKVKIGLHLSSTQKLLKMKNLKLFLLFISVSVMSFSCGSDDDGGSPSGSGVFVYGDTEIQLKAGIIEDYGEYTNGVYNFDIVLVDSEITDVDGDPFPVNSTFSGVYFEIFTNNASDVGLGTYTFGSDEAGAYEYAEIYIDATIEGDGSILINSGSFTVLDNGSSYELEFEGTTTNGVSFSGSFTGALQAYDYSEELNRSSVTNSDKRKIFS